MKAKCHGVMKKNGGSLELSFIFDVVAPIDRERRIQECWRFGRSIAQRSGAREIDNDEAPTFVFEGRDDKQVRRIAGEIETRLTRILRMPLTPKVVDRALGITARERLRWDKDGRLPICGHGRIGQGNHIVRHPLFPATGTNKIP